MLSSIHGITSPAFEEHPREAGLAAQSQAAVSECRLQSPARHNTRCDTNKGHDARGFRRDGITLIELLVFVLLIAGMMQGCPLGAKIGAPYGPWMRVLGAIVGAILGGLVVVLFMVLVAAAFSLFAAIKRVRRPADLVCRCGESAGTVPQHLVPQEPIQHEAIAESHRLAEWPDYARLQPKTAHTPESLRSRLAEGSLSQERVALAARLGDPSAQAIGVAPVTPVVQFPRWDRLPEDMQAVLRSGLPPRLCMVWIMACVQRVLPVFESEFHQDTRPRQAFGAALLVLKTGHPEAMKLCRSLSRTVWLTEEAGCRVLHRDFKDRFLGRFTPGQRAAKAVFRLARAIWEWADPEDLWKVYSPGDIGDGYATPQNRCETTQPAFNAEQTAYDASLVTAEPQVEQQWQREELARLILGWETWDQDRQAWQDRVDQEWVPRVLRELKNVRFDIPAYAERLRRDLVPWRSTQVDK